jgi:hypothetical protein
MSCALREVLRQGLESPDHRELREDLIKRFQDDPQFFFYLKSSLELSLPKELGFEERIVRMTCDQCALDPLQECTLVEVLVSLLREQPHDGRGTK